MNKKLSLPQALLALLILLVVSGFVAYRYFTAPAFPGEDPRDKPLYNTAITEIALVMGPLAPPHISATASPRRGGGGGGGGGAVTPKGEAARVEAARYAKEVAPKYLKVTQSLREAGIPVASDDVTKKAAQGKVALALTITLEGNGTVVDGQPTMGVLGYKVGLKREVFTSPSAANPVQLDVAGNMTGSVGVTSPETLLQKQDEALTSAVRALVARWREDNLAPAK